MTAQEVAQLILKKSKKKISEVDLQQFAAATSDFSNSWTMVQKAWHLVNKTSQQPICQQCTNSCKFMSNKYWAWCSQSCMGKDPRVLEKKRKTNMQKWGTECPQALDSVKDKQRKTLIDKYGEDNYAKTAAFKENFKEHCLKKYGVDNPSKCKQVVDKIRESANNRNYQEVVEKRTNTYLQTCGKAHNKQMHMTNESIAKLHNVPFLVDQHYVQKKACSEIAKELGCSATPILTRLADAGFTPIRHGISAVETEIVNYLHTLTANIQRNVRSLIPPYEIDIFLPELNVAIEVNGVYWHSELQGKHKQYHVAKTQKCEDQHIQLLHIYDSEWFGQQDIVKSKLAGLFASHQRIFARKCVVSAVAKEEKKRFLDLHHLQGTCGSRVDLGLYYQGELVSLMTFGRPRFSKKYQWELVRFCNKLYTTVVGGASRLFANFVASYTPESIISYADRRWSTGQLYPILGFSLLHCAAPNYAYFRNSSAETLESRIKYQKHKLLELFGSSVDLNKTEWEIMQDHRYNRIWDCGNRVYLWEPK